MYGYFDFIRNPIVKFISNTPNAVLTEFDDRSGIYYLFDPTVMRLRREFENIKGAKIGGIRVLANVYRMSSVDIFGKYLREPMVLVTPSNYDKERFEVIGEEKSHSKSHPDKLIFEWFYGDVKSTVEERKRYSQLIVENCILDYNEKTISYLRKLF